MTWHTYWPGTAAPPETSKRSYKYVADNGSYTIDPLFSPSGRFHGYRVYALNEQGKFKQPCGLWDFLGDARTLQIAKRLVRDHQQQHS